MTKCHGVFAGWMLALLLGCGGGGGKDGPSPAGGQAGTALGSGDAPGGAHATGGRGECIDGIESCPCYRNGTCDGGLVCVSHVCVVLPTSGGTASIGEPRGGGAGEVGELGGVGTTTSGGTSGLAGAGAPSGGGAGPSGGVSIGGTVGGAWAGGAA